jgi:regulator of protease activity HflC (stomatin/prohibitin superfamily)
MNEAETKQWIFLTIIIGLITFIFILFLFKDEIIENLFWFILLLGFLLIITKFPVLLLLKDYERAVIFRFGKVNRVGGPGWAFIIPVIESHRQVDLRVKTIDVAKQDVVTKDNIEIKVDAVIYLKIKKDVQSVINSVIEVEDYQKAMQLYVIATVRNILGSFNLTEAISNIDELNRRLVSSLEKVSVNWGVRIDAAEIKDLEIPPTVLNAMHEEKAAAQQKTARIHLAEANKAEIEAVREAAEKLSDKALAYYYIQALEKLGQSSSTKFIFPMELTKLASLIGAGKTAVNENELTELFEKYAPLMKKIVKKK